ncbi:MAG: adenylate/guanylate cyclase domain-containing protein [Gammaproteobacteria bacterium]
MQETALRLVVLYADISSSTRIYEQYGDAIARQDISTCLNLLSEVANEHDGKTIKTIGDEIMCIFHDPIQAATAAIEMQQALITAGKKGRFRSEPLHVKIGWHYGSASVRQDDVIGEAPVLAQQVSNMAKRDEILTTGTSIHALPAELSQTSNFIDRVEAEQGHGHIDVYALPWEEDGGEITELRSKPATTGALVHIALLLDYGGKSLKIDNQKTHCLVGRGEKNDLVVNGEFTSRHHAEIYYRHGRFHLNDMSTNGTAVIRADGHMVRLHRGEELLSGSGVIYFGGEPDIDPRARVKYKCISP